MVYILSRIVHKFFFVTGLVHQHPELTLFGTDDHRLAAHAADHVKRIQRPPPEGQLQHVLLNAALQGLLQVVGDLEEAVGRAKPPDALMRTLVVVILDPEDSALNCLFEAVELGPLEELPQDRLPETLDLAQRHRVVGTGADVLDAVLFHLPFETGLTPPVRILATVVGKHLFGDAVFSHPPAVGLQDVFGRLAAVQSQGGDVAAVVVHEANQVGVASR
jgi:peptidoglycan/xylan/chitin deacetylase (PgdA/CDA1 family)